MSPFRCGARLLSSGLSGSEGLENLLRSRKSRTGLTRLALFLTALVTMLPRSHATTGEPEDELRSAIVLSFLRYSAWSDRVAENSPLTVGVVGRSSFPQVLRRALEGESANSHPIRVLDLTTAGNPPCCQVIYVATGKSAEIRSALQRTRACRALTIGEDDRFLEYGGAVNLLIVDGHMSFEVSLEALDRSGVEISSKLLRFGQIRGKVRPAP